LLDDAIVREAVRRTGASASLAKRFCGLAGSR